MREDIDDESVDLIYLDPPFNSKRLYNAFIGGAQWVAFDDTWRWHEAVDDFHDVARDIRLAPAMEGLRQMLGEGPNLAYLSYMANRLRECRRVLKPEGSIYFHCDHAASHYIKALMDVVFGHNNFRNEIIWKRRYGAFSAVHTSKKFGTSTDSIFFYAASNKANFNPQYTMDDPDYQEYIRKTFRHVDQQGRRYRIADLANPAPRPNLMYDYKGYAHPKNGWAISREKMEKWDKEGRLHFPKSQNGRIQRRRFFDELKGKPVQNFWSDIRVRTHYSHQMTAAARAIAAMKFLMLRSKRVAIRRQSLRRQNMRSMMLRCL